MTRVSVALAMDFVRTHGTPVEAARMEHVMTGEPTNFSMVGQAAAGQNPDGGWPAPWSQGKSSLDATCFQLSAIDQLGARQGTAAVDRGLDFLESRMTNEGWVEESEGLEVPPWLAYGVEKCRAYLTSNCAFWLTTLGRSEAGEKMATWITAHVYDPFDQTRWLTAGLLWQLGDSARAAHLLDDLLVITGSLPVTSVAWMGWTLLRSGVPPQHPVLISAAERLARTQSPEGGWSEDHTPNAHSTIEGAAVLWAVRESLR